MSTEFNRVGRLVSQCISTHDVYRNPEFSNYRITTNNPHKSNLIVLSKLLNQKDWPVELQSIARILPADWHIVRVIPQDGRQNIFVVEPKRAHPIN